MEKLLNLIQEHNDRDHKEIKEKIKELKLDISGDVKYIKDKIAPKVSANERAITIILFIIAAAGYAKALGAF